MSESPKYEQNFDSKINDLVKLYTDLHCHVRTNIQTRWRDRQTETFYVGGAGKKYREYYDNNTGPRLMVIGRATNGWYRIKYGDDEEIYKNIVSAFMQKSKNEGVYWAEIKNQKSNVIVNKCLKDELNDKGVIETRIRESYEKPYYFNCSPFCRVARDVFAGLSKCSVDGFWMDNIAWSNLYKISPEKRNPCATSIKLQNDYAAQILSLEITINMPQFILFITEKRNDLKGAWIAPFTNDKQFQITNHSSPFIYKSGFYNSIPTIISCRPESNNEKSIVNDVVREFKSLSQTK